MASAPLQVDEEALIREFVAGMKLPPGVKLLRVDQSSDWQGEPALRIFFSVSKKLPLTPARVKALSRMKSALQDAVFEAKLVKWPFVHFVEVK